MPLVDGEVAEVLLNPGDIGVVPIVVLLTVMVVPCPETKLVSVIMVQLRVVEEELLKLLLEGVPTEYAAGVLTIVSGRPNGNDVDAAIVLVIETDALARLELGTGIGAMLEELLPDAASASAILVLRDVGSLSIVRVRVTGSPVRAVDPPLAIADG